MSQQLWTVVKFPKSADNAKETVEAIPTSWLFEEGSANKCYWPPLEKSDLAKAIKACWSPNLSDWATHSIHILSKKNYDTFKVATSRATKALKFSDIDTDAEIPALPAKRSRITKKKFDYSLSPSSAAESTDEDDESQNIPKYPKVINSARLSNTPTSNTPTLSASHPSIFVENSAISTNTPGQPKSPSVSTENSAHLAGTSGQPKCPASTSFENAQNVRPHSPDSRRLAQSEEAYVSRSQLAYLYKTIIEDHKILKQQRESLNRIENALEELKTNVEKRPTNNLDLVETNDPLKNVLNFFPLTTDEEFSELEEILISQPELTEFLAKSLAIEGSSNNYKSVRRIMKMIMTNELSQIYSFKGHKGKKKFGLKKLSNVIIKAVQLCDNTTKTKQVEVELSIWLAKASTRKN